VIRGDASLRRDLESVALEAGDTVVVRTRDAELMGFREGTASGAVVSGLEAARARRSTVIEVLVAPNAKAIGRTLRTMRWRRRFGVYPLALHHEGEAGPTGSRTRASPSATRSCSTARPTTSRGSRASCGSSSSARSGRAPFAAAKAPVAVGALAAVVILAALDVSPILPLALIAAAVALVAGAVDADEGFGAMDGRLLLLIISMLVLGTAMDRSGALTLVIDALTPVFAASSPLVALALLYAVTSILTELITNNAVAVLMTPIAAGIATSLGLDPRPFVVAVMFAASASFATPIGYQTNTLVYNAGGYRFRDFLRLGVPMNLVVGTTTILLIPRIWPLIPS
jgi:hypothetical protein